MTPQQMLQRKLGEAKRLAVLGVGSDLRADDGVGLRAARRVGETFHGRKRENGAICRIFLGHTAPENLTGAIRKFRPTHLVVIDAADMALRPGAIRVIDRDDVGGLLSSTHRLPLKLLADYLTASAGCSIVFIGIQPQTIRFGRRSSRATEQAVETIAGWFKRIAEKR
jgi:hydrogenase 3 maturation protease